MVHFPSNLLKIASCLAAVASANQEIMANSTDLASINWDTHCHLFEPEKYPLSPNRSYTPKAASSRELLASSPGESFLLVQASVEDGREALLAHIKDLQSHLKGDNVVRAEIIFGEDTDLSEDELLRLHRAGVRVLRGYARTSNDTAETANEMKRLLKGRMGEIARRYGWIVSFQLAPAVWTLLEDFPWKQELPGVHVIAEHLGSVNVPLDSESQRGLDSLLSLMRQDVLTVKINALHRRGFRGHESEMMDVVSQLAETGPERLIWGSDWPHVNSSASGSEPADFLPVNETQELSWLRSFLPEDTYESMIYKTPTRLFY
ncbi:hypothetical protein Q7P37_003151 [Cladosporium fusiforme]